MNAKTLVERPYRERPIMPIANKLDDRDSKHVIGLYEEANNWHRTARDLSRGCAALETERDAARSQLAERDARIKELEERLAVAADLSVALARDAKRKDPDEPYQGKP